MQQGVRGRRRRQVQQPRRAFAWQPSKKMMIYCVCKPICMCQPQPPISAKRRSFTVDCLSQPPFSLLMNCLIPLIFPKTGRMGDISFLCNYENSNWNITGVILKKEIFLVPDGPWKSKKYLAKVKSLSKLCQKALESASEKRKTKTNNKEDKDTRGDHKFSTAPECPWKNRKGKKEKQKREKITCW